MNDPQETEFEDTIASAQPKGGLAPGMLLKERYKVEKELGAGGIGMVFLAQDTQLYNRLVVIKVLLQSSDASAWLQKKFRQEIEALVRIRHPGVVGVFDAGQLPDNKLFVVMEFVEGVNLRSVLKEMQGRIELARAANIMRQIGPALTAAHDEGVTHCDLKPENIMLQPLKQGDELVKLIDFGVAKVKDSLVAAMTETKVAGTFLYMAPEQLMGNPIAASDIYALGVIAYEMLTLKGPFPARTVAHLYELQRSGTPVSPRQARPDLPQAAEDAILKALAFDPETRYQRARDFTEDLARALAPTAVAPKIISQPVSVPPTVITPIAPEPGKKRTNPLLFVIPILLVLIAGGFFAFMKLRPPTTQLPVTKSLPAPPAPVVKERQMNYYVMLQRWKDGKEFGDPRRLAKEVVFEKDYRIQVFFSSPDSGYMYLISEGAEPRYNRTSYNVLYPANNGSAQVMPNQLVQFPEKTWIKFDAEAGTEKLWMIWAAEKVAELEAVKGVANSEERGVVSDPNQLDALDKFFAEQSENKPTVEKMENYTTVKVRNPILVNLLPLEHY